MILKISRDIFIGRKPMERATNGNRQTPRAGPRSIGEARAAGRFVTPSPRRASQQRVTRAQLRRASGQLGETDSSPNARVENADHAPNSCGSVDWSLGGEIRITPPSQLTVVVERGSQFLRLVPCRRLGSYFPEKSGASPAPHAHGDNVRRTASFASVMRGFSD